MEGKLCEKTEWHMKLKADTRVVQLQTKEQQPPANHQKVEENRFSLIVLRANKPCQYLPSWISRLEKYSTINSV